MIAAENLTKIYGERTAVKDLSFRVEPGLVTGFLGPNGAGKSTTMRMIVGLDAPTSGAVLVNGRTYASSRAPLHEVGVLLEARAIHTGRSARGHLLALAASNRIPKQRADEVLELVGLTDVARKRVGSFSLGMGQRLGIAAALLGDPATVILDEPINGLDPEGVLWVRGLLRSLAAEGRTVFVSSHLMSEMALTADRLIVVGRGELLADSSVAEFIAKAGGSTVRVRSPELRRLLDLLPEHRATGEPTTDGALDIRGITAETLGMLCFEERIPLLELAPQTASLEAAFLDMTRDSVEYSARKPETTRLPEAETVTS